MKDIKALSFSGLTRESTGNGLSGQLSELCSRDRVAPAGIVKGIKVQSLPDLIRQSTGNGLSGQLSELCSRDRVAPLFSTVKIVF